MLAVKPIAPQAARSVPFALPASYFVAALGFLAAVGLMLPVIAEHLAAGRYLHPQVVGVVHLITLGWLTLSIMGALCQLFPVTLGTPLYSVRIAVATLVLYVPGVMVFAIGLFTGRLNLAIGAATAFASALLLFSYNAYRTLFRGTNRDLAWWALAVAFGFLLATIAFGASLAINLKTAHLGPGRITALAIHVHVAVAGWVGLVIMAVGRRLLPMFLLSHGTHERPLRIAIITTATGAGLLALFHRMMTPLLFDVAAVLLIIGCGALVIQIAGYLHTRHRPQLDPGLRLVLSGAAFIVLAALLGTGIIISDAGARLVTAYGVALLGGLLLFVAGHHYKILPFLLWNHRFAPHAGRRPLPKIADLYDRRIAGIAAATSIAGMAGIIGGVLASNRVITTFAATLVTAGCVLEAIQLIRLLRIKVA